jgi:hypothetical protein
VCFLCRCASSHGLRGPSALRRPAHHLHFAAKEQVPLVRVRCRWWRKAFRIEPTSKHCAACKRQFPLWFPTSWRAWVLAFVRPRPQQYGSSPREWQRNDRGGVNQGLLALDVLGSIEEGELRHVLYRWQSEAPQMRMSQVEVRTLRQYKGAWRLLSPMDLQISLAGMQRASQR